MVIKRNEKKSARIVDCHGGTGELWYTVIFSDNKKTTPGFKYLHDNVLEPGASIGEHRHQDDEEIYVILAGHGVMRVDGADIEIGPGDVCVTRSGHSHALINGSSAPMHFLVVCVQTGGKQ